MRHFKWGILLAMFVCFPHLLLAQQDSIPPNVFVSEPANYDLSVVAYWAYVAPISVQFQQDSIIVDSNRYDPILLPTHLPLKQSVWYEEVEGDTLYLLSLTRLNYTDLRFRVEKLSDTILFEQWEGTARLSPQFYLGSEGAYENDGGELFGLNAYTFHTSDS